jgi:hypothetical protein
MTSPVIEFHRRPSAAKFMLSALIRLPSRSRATWRVPPLAVHWRGHRAEPGQLADFLELTGLNAGPSLPILYPYVFGFRLPMVILTHPLFPIPIWSALQVRNHILQHRPIPADAVMDLETRVAAQRLLDKGTEVDLHTTVNVNGSRAWECLNVFYYRGRFGVPEGASPASVTPPPTPSTVAARWRLPRGVGWRFARMTGDYNGIHRWGWYARLFQFQRAFFHPQMIAGQCLARLPEPGREGPQRLDLWIRGPAYFDADVTLCAAPRGTATEFALMVEGDERPAMLARWAAADSHGQPLAAA